MSFRIPASFGEQFMRSMEGVPDAEAQIESFEDSLGFDLEQDLFSWFHGEASLVLLPGETLMGSDLPVTGYFTLRPSDLAAAEAGMERIIAALEELAGGDLGLSSEQLGGAAFQVFAPEGESLAGYGFVNETLVIGVGPAALAASADADTRLGDAQSFGTATTTLPDPNGGLLYVALPALLDMLEEQGMMDDEDREDLRPFQAIAAASSPGLDDEGFARSRLFISVEAAE
jgi:hypothetical protein